MIDLAERRKRRRKHSYKTGEDIEMLREKNSKSEKRDSICDTHIDGAWSQLNDTFMVSFIMLLKNILKKDRHLINKRTLLIGKKETILCLNLKSLLIHALT